MSSVAVVSAFDELSRLQRQTYVVGNAGDEPIERQVFGHPYRWSAGEEKPITDHMDYPRDAKGQIPRDNFGNIRVPASIVRAQSLDIVKALFSDEDGFKGGEFGLYLLRGDGQDSARRQIAYDAYVAQRVRRAETDQAAWVERTENVKPGDPPLVASPRLRGDLAFLAKHRAGLMDRKAFWSKFGDFESDDRNEVVSHLRSIWPVQWDAKGDSLVISRDALTPAPQAVPAPRLSASTVMTAGLPAQPAVSTSATEATESVDKEQVEWLVAQAIELGSPLTFDELQAVMRGESATIDAVMERLSQVKKTGKPKGAKSKEKEQ